MSEVQIYRGPGPYERQSGKTNVIRPLILAGVYAVVIAFYAVAVYLEAILTGLVFGPVLVGAGLQMLLRVSFAGGLTIRRKTIDGGKRLIASILIAAGVLLIYLRVIPNGWPWSLAVSDGALWIGTPWAGFAIPAAWVALRYGLAITLPIGLIPAGIVLLSRILMEIGYPNLADSVRAMAGQLLSKRWIGYPAHTEPTPEPTPTSNKPAPGGSL